MHATWLSACQPQPITPRDRAPSRARCRAATPLAAPVRSWPSRSASITATVSPGLKRLTTNVVPSPAAIDGERAVALAGGDQIARAGGAAGERQALDLRLEVTVRARGVDPRSPCVGIRLRRIPPVSSLAAATRELFGNPTAIPDGAPWTLGHPVASSLIWCVALLSIAVPLTVRRFRAKTTE